MNNLSNEQKLFVCDVINNLGEGDRPVADLESLCCFNKQYILNLLLIVEKSTDILTASKTRNILANFI